MDSLEKKVGSSAQERINQLVQEDTSFKQDYQEFGKYEKAMTNLVACLINAPMAYTYSTLPNMDVARLILANESKGTLMPFGYNAVPSTDNGFIIGEVFENDELNFASLTDIWGKRVDDILSHYGGKQTLAGSINTRLAGKKIDLDIKDDPVDVRLPKGAYTALSHFIDKSLALASQSMYDLIQANVVTGRRLNNVQVPMPTIQEGGKRGVRYETKDLETPIVAGASSSLFANNMKYFSELEQFMEITKQYESPESQAKMQASFDNLVGRQYDAMLETARFCYMIGNDALGNQLVEHSEHLSQFGYQVDESDRAYIAKIETGTLEQFGQPIEYANPAEAMANSKNYLFPDMSPKSRGRAVRVPAAVAQQIMKQAQAKGNVQAQYKR